jgi:TrmH family RNA methyltransferase
LVMGNEANGVSDKLRTLSRNIVSIPQYSSEGSKTESLNVAMATGLILGEIRRQHNLFKA